jgi:hypothetical protein
MWPSRRLALSFASKTFIGWRNAAIAALASRISDSGSFLATELFKLLAAVKSKGEPKNLFLSTTRPTAKIQVQPDSARSRRRLCP